MNSFFLYPNLAVIGNKRYLKIVRVVRAAQHNEY